MTTAAQDNHEFLRTPPAGVFDDQTTDLIREILAASDERDRKYAAVVAECRLLREALRMIEISHEPQHGKDQ